MVDAIEARTLKHKTVLDLARHAMVPVINGLTDYNHPTQVVCDVFTMIEHRLLEKRLEDLNVTFVGDATNVCSSLMMICTLMGMGLTHAAPARHQAPSAWREFAQASCAQSGRRLTVTDDPVAAVRDADFVYTHLWWWVGQEDEIPDRRAAFMPRYQVNAALFAAAPAHAKMMHCLPASRGVEATDEVLDGPRSRRLASLRACSIHLRRFRRWPPRADDGDRDRDRRALQFRRQHGDLDDGCEPHGASRRHLHAPHHPGDRLLNLGARRTSRLGTGGAHPGRRRADHPHRGGAGPDGHAGGAGPMTVSAPAGRWQNARNRLDPRIRGVEMEANDAWACDHGPGFVLDGKGTRRGVRWGFNAWDGLDDDLCFPLGSGFAGRLENPRDRRREPVSRAADPGRRLDPCRRRRHALDD